MTTRLVPSAMTIAGSDSGAARESRPTSRPSGHGLFGTCAITTITAQNTIGVKSVRETPTEMIEAQIDAIVTDIGADAVKTGMLSSNGSSAAWPSASSATRSRRPSSIP